LNRILPEGEGGVDAVIDAGKLRVLPVFVRIRELGNVADADMLRTFNCGIGMTMVCGAGAVGKIVEHLKGFGMEAYEIGEIVEGNGTVRYSGKVRW